MNLANGALSKPPTIDKAASTKIGIVMARPGRLVTGVRTGPKKTRTDEPERGNRTSTRRRRHPPPKGGAACAELPALHRMRSLL